MVKLFKSIRPSEVDFFASFSGSARSGLGDPFEARLVGAVRANF